jgi:transcriptional regulator with XRE-family HTH domain
MTYFSHIARLKATVDPRIYGKDYLSQGSHSARVARRTSTKSVNHLRAWREFRQMTQAELAAKVGTSDNVISLLESGGRRLSDTWLNKLAPALGTRPGFLLEFDPNDADLSILEAILDMEPNRRREALRLLRVFKTGTDDE